MVHEIFGNPVEPSLAPFGFFGFAGLARCHRQHAAGEGDSPWPRLALWQNEQMIFTAWVGV